jgi:phosphocarrier protein
MQRKTIAIPNKLGLHARAAAKFVQIASGFPCEVKIAKGTREVNGKSIMGVMMLAAGQGVLIDIIVEGEEEVLALAELEKLVSNRFGEDE